MRKPPLKVSRVSLNGRLFLHVCLFPSCHVALPFPFNLEVTSLYSKINCRPLQLLHVRASCFHRRSRVSQSCNHRSSSARVQRQRGSFASKNSLVADRKRAR
jgi:hypothetical protein